MAEGTGVASQLMVKLETTVGTAVTPDTGLPMISEGIKRGEPPTISKAIRPNRRVLLSAERNGGNVQIAGPIGLELTTASMRPLLTCMFGAESGTGPYVYRPATKKGKSLTAQIGRPDVGGTVRPFTFAGMKVMQWDIACASGETANLGLDVQTCLVDEDTATTLVTSTIADALRPFKFSGATVTVAGDAVPVSSMNVHADLKLAGKWNLGSQFSIEPRTTDREEYTGKLMAEFESLVHYNHYKAHDELALVMTFTGPASASLVITQHVIFDPMGPNVAGRDVLDLEIPYTCLSADANDYSAIQATYTLPA